MEAVFVGHVPGIGGDVLLEVGAAPAFDVRSVPQNLQAFGGGGEAAGVLFEAVEGLVEAVDLVAPGDGFGGAFAMGDHMEVHPYEDREDGAEEEFGHVDLTLWARGKVGGKVGGGFCPPVSAVGDI